MTELLRFPWVRPGTLGWISWSTPTIERAIQAALRDEAQEAAAARERERIVEEREPLRIIPPRSFAKAAVDLDEHHDVHPAVHHDVPALGIETGVRGAWHWRILVGPAAEVERLRREAAALESELARVRSGRYR